MGSLDLSVQVLNISPKATQADLNTFFSYCGTIDNIQLQRDGDQSQLAFVTFKQPYAQKTALLLNDAIIIDRRIIVLPLKNLMTDSKNSSDAKKASSEVQRGFISTAQSVIQVMASKGYEALNKAKELDEKYRVSQRRRQLTQVAVERAGSAITKGTSALRLSGALDKAVKCTAELRKSRNKNESNSRKQK